MIIFSWIVFGLVVGLIANILDPKTHNIPGTLGAILMGILGAATGGFLSSIFFGVNLNQFNLIPLLSAGISSILLLFVGNYLVDSS
jgi:uncharacterized membrane protein YeaQ/YmgE (transglycosylase-associated protein family)